MRYGVRTTVRVSDEWLSVCAERLFTGYKPQETTGCIHLAKSNRCYLNQFPRYKGAIFFINPPTIPFVGRALDQLYPDALHNA